MRDRRHDPRVRGAAVDGDALGVDLSAAMLDGPVSGPPRQGLTNVEFVQADAQVHPFAPSAFDVVVSRFGVMFFADPGRRVHRTSPRDGPGRASGDRRLAGSARNEWCACRARALALGRSLPTRRPSAPGPFGLADPDGTRGVLDAAGFGQVAFDDVAVPFWFGADADAAIDFAREIGMLRGLLDGLDADDTRRGVDALRDAMVAHDAGDGVVLDSRTWVVTAVR